MRVKRGELWLANLNPAIGTEPGKVRPVVIIQSDLLNHSHPSVVICPLTTRLAPEPNTLRVRIHPSNSGLVTSSDILVDQIKAIDGSRLLRRIGFIDKKTLEPINKKLRDLLDNEPQEDI